jgi:hypothetical protein
MSIDLSKLSNSELSNQVSRMQAELDKRQYESEEKTRLEQMKELRKILKSKNFGKRIIIARESDKYDLKLNFCTYADQPEWINNKLCRNFKRAIFVRQIPKYLNTGLLEYVSNCLIEESNRICKNNSLLLYGIEPDMYYEHMLIRYKFLENDKIRYKGKER